MSSAASSIVTCLHYLDVTPAPETLTSDPTPNPNEDPRLLDPSVPAGVPEEEVQARIAGACLAERLSTEQRLRHDHALEQTALQQGIVVALHSFVEERSSYFARVESEIVHLAMAIARKILQREAQLDPLLLAGLVRIALDGMQSGPAVRVRVPPNQVSTWQHHFLGSTFRRCAEVLADASLGSQECVLETDVGSARLSYETQLKEIERGFVDLLGQRPDRPRPHPEAAQTAPECLL